MSLVIIMFFIFVWKIDGIANAVHQIKQSVDSGYGYRNKKVLDLSEYKPLQNGKNEWYQKYHFISHSMGGIDGKIYTDSQEAMESSYQKGNRVFDADLNITNDGKLVLRHEWSDALEQDEISEKNIPDYITFMNTAVYCKYTPLDAESLLAFMKENKDIYVACDAKKNITEIYGKLVDTAKEQGYVSELDRIIVSFYECEDYK